MVRRCVKVLSGQEYAAKIINTKKLSARGENLQEGLHTSPTCGLTRPPTHSLKTTFEVQVFIYHQHNRTLIFWMQTVNANFENQSGRQDAGLEGNYQATDLCPAQMRR